MNKEIITWLEGPRVYAQGVSLYERFGFNRRLKEVFRRQGETKMTVSLLIEELRKLSGLTEQQFLALKRKAVQKPKAPRPIYNDDDQLLELAERLGVSVEELTSDDFVEKYYQSEEMQDKIEELTAELEKAKTMYAKAPEMVRRQIKIREEYPFLNQPDCPDVLKVLTADLFSAYYRYRDAYAELQQMPDNADAVKTAELAETVVENYLTNKELWAELDYYKEHGEILGKSEAVKKLLQKEDVESLSDIELTTKLSNARANLSKAKKNLETAENEDKREKAMALLDKWENTVALLSEELEKRKKK